MLEDHPVVGRAVRMAQTGKYRDAGALLEAMGELSEDEHREIGRPLTWRDLNNLCAEHWARNA